MIAQGYTRLSSTRPLFCPTSSPIRDIGPKPNSTCLSCAQIVCLHAAFGRMHSFSCFLVRIFFPIEMNAVLESFFLFSQVSSESHQTCHSSFSTFVHHFSPIDRNAFLASYQYMEFWNQSFSAQLVFIKDPQNFHSSDPANPAHTSIRHEPPFFFGIAELLPLHFLVEMHL